MLFISPDNSNLTLCIDCPSEYYSLSYQQTDACYSCELQDQGNDIFSSLSDVDQAIINLVCPVPTTKYKLSTGGIIAMSVVFPWAFAIIVGFLAFIILKKVVEPQVEKARKEKQGERVPASDHIW